MNVELLQKFINFSIIYCVDKFQFDEDQSYVAEFMGGIFLIEQRMEIWSKIL